MPPSPTPRPWPGPAEPLDGRLVARGLHARLVGRVAAVVARRGRPPGLALVQVGFDPASSAYVRRKEVVARRLGIASRVVGLPAAAEPAALLAAVAALNRDPAVDALLVQLPLPPHLRAVEATAHVDPAKDADGLHPDNIGQLVAGRPRLIPCTPAGVLALLDHYEVPLVGAHAVVVGRSAIVGRPLAALLLRRHATVTHCHRHTRNLAERVREAELLVVAAGRPGLVPGDWIAPGAVVVDVGLTRVAGSLVGDVDALGAAGRARLLTPVPGGVGPMTVAMLMHNTVVAAGG